MILVIGGLASGKRAYVRGLGFPPEQFDDGVFGEAPVLVNLHDALRDDTRMPEQIAAALEGKEAITCCEVGSGVVPIDGEERAWRELVGRTCNILAEHAESVVRMVCGIPIVLK